MMGLKDVAKVILGYLMMFGGVAMWLFAPPQAPEGFRWFGFFLACVGGAILRFYPTRTVRVTY